MFLDIKYLQAAVSIAFGVVLVFTVSMKDWRYWVLVALYVIRASLL